MEFVYYILTRPIYYWLYYTCKHEWQHYSYDWTGGWIQCNRCGIEK